MLASRGQDAFCFRPARGGLARVGRLVTTRGRMRGTFRPRLPGRSRRAVSLGVCIAAAAIAAGPAPAGALEIYWQQHVQYAIHVTLDPGRHLLTGREELVYRNASPDTLREVWFHAYPNAYKDDRSVFARELLERGKRDFAFSSAAEKGWIVFDAWRCDGESVLWTYKPGDETEILLELPRPIPPGGAARFELEFRVQVPELFS